MSNMGASDDDEQVPTPWDQRVVRSMAIADSARGWATALRWVSLVVAAATVIGNYLLFIRGGDDFDNGGIPTRLKFGQFLQSSATPLAFAGLILALSFFVSIYAARLDLDIVLADNDETGGPAAAP